MSLITHEVNRGAVELQFRYQDGELLIAFHRGARLGDDTIKITVEDLRFNMTEVDEKFYYGKTLVGVRLKPNDPVSSTKGRMTLRRFLQVGKPVELRVQLVQFLGPDLILPADTLIIDS